MNEAFPAGHCKLSSERSETISPVIRQIWEWLRWHKLVMQSWRLRIQHLVCDGREGEWRVEKMGKNVGVPMGYYYLYTTTQPNTRGQEWSHTSGSLFRGQRMKSNKKQYSCFPGIERREQDKVILPYFCSSWTMQSPFWLIAYSEETQMRIMGRKHLCSHPLILSFLCSIFIWRDFASCLQPVLGARTQRHELLFLWMLWT